MAERTWLRRHGWALALWSLLCALFFSTFLLQQEHFSGGDITGQFYAFGLFQAQELAQGRLPVWSPGSYGGIPFAGDTQAAVFYPIRWLTILFSLPWDFPYYALELEVIFHVWLTGLFTYALGYSSAKKQVTAPMGAQAAGLVGACAFSLSGYLASYPLSQLAILETITWLPLILLLLRTAVSQEKPLRWILAAALALTLSALAGHPQTFLHVSYVAAAYYIFLAVRARWRWSWLLGLGGLLTAVTLGIWTIAWLPAIRFLTTTVRSEVGYQFVSSGTAMLDFIQVLVPGSWSLASASYVGMGALVLAGLAWYGRRQLADHTEITFWAVMTLLTGWLALGDAGILFKLAYWTLPGFSLFRQQERLLSIFCFSLALLAVQGVVVWWQSSPDWRRQFARRASVVLAGLLSTAGIMLLAAQAFAQPNWAQVWWQQVGITAVTLILLWLSPRRRWPILALILILMADLYRPSLVLIERQPGSPTIYWAEPNWLAEAQTIAPARIDSDDRIFANVGEAFGLEDIRGISPLKPQVMADLKTIPLARRWQLLNVVYALQDSPSENLPLVETAVSPPLYRFTNALPRAWMSYQPIAAPNAAAALEQLQQPDFDPAASVVLHPPLPDLSQIAPPDTPPQVEIERRQANELAISVTTEAPGLLVLSEWAYPGWRATVNGRAATLYPANYAFQTLLLPAGTHQISLKFLPPDVIIGGIVALLTLLAASLVAWRWQPVISFRDTKRPAISVPPILSRLSAIFERRSFAFQPNKWHLLFITFLGFALRVFRLGQQELRGDEAFSYLFASQSASDIIGNLLREGDPHSPLHYLLLHGWMGLAGNSEFAMRFLSLVPGVLLIPLVYLLGRRLGGKQVGWLTAVFITLSQSQIWLAQDVRNQYTLTLFFTALATFLLVQLTEKGRTRKTAVALAMWAAYAVSAALAVYSHYYGGFALLAHGLFLIFNKSRRRVLLSWVGSGVTAVALFAIWFVPMWPQLVRAGQVTEPSRPKLAPYLTAVGSELTTGSALDGGWVRWLFLGALGLCLLGFGSQRFKKSGGAILLASWLASAALGIFLIRFRRATFNDFYISVAAPAWWLLVASGMAALARRDRWRWLAAAGVIVLLGASAVSLRNYYFDPAYSRTRGYRAIAAHIAAAAGAEADPNDLFLAHFPDPSLDYYLRDVALPRTMQPAKSGIPAAETEAALAQLAADYGRIWFVPAHNSVWDLEDVVPHWLDFHTLHEQRLRFDHLELLAYRPISQLEAVTTLVNMALENGITLDSFFVTVNGRAVDPSQPVTVPPEAALGVTLIWAAPQPIAQDYTVFVHLLAEDGRLLAQHDGVPAAGTRPTTTWLAGDIVLDWHELGSGEGGNGRVVVGMYDNQTQTRQLFANGQDAYPIMQTIRPQ